MQLKIEKKNKKVKKKDRAQANKPASAQANLSREPCLCGYTSSIPTRVGSRVK